MKGRVKDIVAIAVVVGWLTPTLYALSGPFWNGNPCASGVYKVNAHYVGFCWDTEPCRVDAVTRGTCEARWIADYNYHVYKWQWNETTQTFTLVGLPFEPSDEGIEIKQCVCKYQVPDAEDPLGPPLTVYAPPGECCTIAVGLHWDGEPGPTFIATTGVCQDQSALCDPGVCTPKTKMVGTTRTFYADCD